MDEPGAAAPPRPQGATTTVTHDVCGDQRREEEEQTEDEEQQPTMAFAARHTSWPERQADQDEHAEETQTSPAPSRHCDQRGHYDLHPSRLSAGTRHL
jgi:hypothetical protein